MLHHCQKRALRPVPQRMSFLVEQAGEPVPKQVIENSAISQLQQKTLSLVTCRETAQAKSGADICHF
jgi:hypothetical protein